MQAMQWALNGVAGPEGQRLAGGLMRALRHVAVRRMQAALLDQLAAHAGMGPALPEGSSPEEGSGQAGEHQQAGSGRDGGG